MTVPSNPSDTYAPAQSQEHTGVITLNPTFGLQLNRSDRFYALSFDDISLDPEEEIISAKLVIQEINNDYGSPRLYFDASPVADPLTNTSFDISNRTFTTEYLDAGKFVPVTGEISINVTVLVQEVVDTFGWYPGARLVAIFEGKGPIRDSWQLNPQYAETKLVITHPNENSMICQIITEDFVLLTIELIDCFITNTNATWVSLSDNSVSDSTKPYIVGKSTRVETPVKILFTQDDLEDRQFFKYRKETSIVEGQVNGYMYAYSEFVPSLKDVVKWNDQEIIVSAVDPIQPIDCPILYFIEFKS